MKTTLVTASFLVLLVSAFACGDGTGGETGGGSSSSSSAVSSSSSTASSSAGGACADATEANETVDSPYFLNDAAQGLSICDTTGISVDAALAGASDVDWFRGYSLMAGGCAPAPTATITGFATPVELCFYLQDDGAPTVKSCPAGTTSSQAGNDYTGCCAQATAGAAFAITLTDIADLDAASANTKFAVKVSGSDQACNAYSLNVHF